MLAWVLNRVRTFSTSSRRGPGSTPLAFGFGVDPSAQLRTSAEHNEAPAGLRDGRQSGLRLLTGLLEQTTHRTDHCRDSQQHRGKDPQVTTDHFMAVRTSSLVSPGPPSWYVRHGSLALCPLDGFTEPLSGVRGISSGTAFC